MNLHLLFFTHANTYIFAPCKKPLLDGCLLYHTHWWEATFKSCCFCRECFFLGWSPFTMGKQLLTEAVALREVGNSGRQVTLHLRCCIFKTIHFIDDEFSYPFHVHAHTHTPPFPPTQVSSFPLHLISGFHSLDVFLCCSNNFGRYCLN